MVNFCKSFKSLVGKTVIVTGSNTGIGYQTALEFAKRGGHVIIACRSPEKGTEALDKIKTLTGNPHLVFKKLDLESLDSVRAFAEDIITNEQRLDILVNNAGAMELPDKITPENVQLELIVNYFSHFLLTVLLLDLMKKSGPGRIVNVSSYVAKFSPKLDMDKLDRFHGGGVTLYGKTKLCQIYFTQELAKRLKGSGVTTYSLHPGAVKTEFLRNSAAFWNFVARVYKTPEEGAQTSIYLALEDGIEELSGRHFADCNVVGDYCEAKDEKVRGLLWEASKKVVGWKEDPKL